MMFCPDCNTDLTAVPIDQACPGCTGNRRSATVLSMTGGKHALVNLRYWSPSTAEQLVDAQKLAHECVDVWREFFKKHGIAEPQC